MIDTMVCTVERIIMNEKDGWDIVSAVGPTVAASIAIGVAIWQAIISYKQKKINNQQKELQRCSFVYDSFLKEKWEKLSQLRELYLNFYENCLALISMVFPSGIASHDSANPPKFSYDNNDSIVDYGFNVGISFASVFINGENVCKELERYIRNNEPFLKECASLIEDLRVVVPVFKKLFQKIGANKDLRTSLEIIAKMMDRNNGSPTILPMDLSGIRSFFYAELWGLILHRGDCNSHLFNLVRGNYFSKFKPVYVEENVQKWSKNNLISFETHSAILTFFNLWLEQINNLFTNAYNDISTIVQEKENGK